MNTGNQRGDYGTGLSARFSAVGCSGVLDGKLEKLLRLGFESLYRGIQRTNISATMTATSNTTSESIIFAKPDKGSRPTK